MNGVRHSILAKRKCPPGCEGQKGEHRLEGRSHSGGEELDSGAKNLMGNVYHSDWEEQRQKRYVFSKVTLLNGRTPSSKNGGKRKQEHV